MNIFIFIANVKIYTSFKRLSIQNKRIYDNNKELPNKIYPPNAFKDLTHQSIMPTQREENPILIKLANGYSYFQETPIPSDTSKR